MKIDISILSVVALCEVCDYRTTRPTQAAAWTALAVHAKAVHGDTRACARARDSARVARARARRQS